MKKVSILFLAIILSSNLFAGRVRTLTCNDKNKENLLSLLDYINENWRSVDEFYIHEGGQKYLSCLKRRLVRNGIVVCHRRNFVGPEYYRCVGASGWANWGGLRANFCANFFDKTIDMEYHNQRACYSGLLFRLYGENCYKRNRFPGTFMTLVEFGFKWYAKYNPVTIDFRDCNYQ